MLKSKLVLFFGLLLPLISGCDLPGDVREAKQEAGQTSEAVRRLEQQIQSFESLLKANSDRLLQNSLQRREVLFDTMKKSTSWDTKLLIAYKLNQSYEFQMFSGEELESDVNVEKTLAEDLEEFFSRWYGIDKNLTDDDLRFIGADSDYDNLAALAVSAHVVRLSNAKSVSKDHLLTRFTFSELIPQTLNELADIRSRLKNNQDVPLWKIVVAKNAPLARRFLMVRFSALVQLSLGKTLAANNTDLFDHALRKWRHNLSHLSDFEASDVTRSLIFPAARTLHYLQKLGVTKPPLAPIESVLDHEQTGVIGYISHNSKILWESTENNFSEIFFSDGHTIVDLNDFDRLWWSRIWSFAGWTDYSGPINLGEVMQNMILDARETYDVDDLNSLLEPTDDEKGRLAAALNLLSEPYK